MAMESAAPTVVLKPGDQKIQEQDSLYRLIPMRILRETPGIKFHEIPPTDIPNISGIDRVLHGGGGQSPGPVGDCKRPWYMHPYQDDMLMVLQGTRFIDVYDPKSKKYAKFVVTPTQIYKNDVLYLDGPGMIVWPAGIFHRIVSGPEGSISINMATRYKQFSIENNFSIYDLDVEKNTWKVVRDGKKDQPDLHFHYPTKELEELMHSKL